MITEEEFTAWLETRPYKKKFNKKIKVPFDDYCEYTEAQWDKYLGTAGTAIYNKFQIPRLQFEDVRVNENNALQEYRERAKVLKNSAQVKALEKKLQSSPFVFIDASSGHGKTQMAFNLEAKGHKVLYILTTPPREFGQEIYQCYKQRQKEFDFCITKDIQTLTEFDSGSIASALKEGFTYGFTEALLLEKNVDKIATREKVKELVDKLKPIVVLDEIPQYTGGGNNDIGNGNRLRFMRNFFISLGMKVLICSTCSSSINMISLGAQSRGSDEDKLWCSVIPRLPSYSGPEEPNDPFFQKLVKNARPLFANWTMGYLQNLNPTLDGLMGYLLEKAMHAKREGAGFFDGQVCLFLSASFEEKDAPLIDGHFADLVEKKPFELWFTGKSLKKRGCNEKWHPKVIFRPMEEDLLLYLALMGGNGRCPFVAKDRIPFIDAIHKALGKNNRKISFSNSNQISNDGMKLESCLAAAVSVASHAKGFKGIKMKLFLKELLYELCGIELKGELAFIGKLKEFKNLTVPYLSPPNQSFPEWFKSRANVADLIRAPNLDEIDLYVEGSIVTGECKDHSKEVQLATMQGILKKVPVDEKLRVHIVVCNNLQTKYFQSPGRSYSQFVSENVKLKKVVVYKLNENGFSEISGITNDYPKPQTAVIFYSTKPKKINEPSSSSRRVRKRIKRH